MNYHNNAAYNDVTRAFILKATSFITKNQGRVIDTEECTLKHASFTFNCFLDAVLKGSMSLGERSSRNFKLSVHGWGWRKDDKGECRRKRDGVQTTVFAPSPLRYYVDFEVELVRPPMIKGIVGEPRPMLSVALVKDRDSPRLVSPHVLLWQARMVRVVEQMLLKAEFNLIRLRTPDEGCIVCGCKEPWVHISDSGPGLVCPKCKNG